MEPGDKSFVHSRDALHGDSPFSFHSGHMVCGYPLPHSATIMCCFSKAIETINFEPQNTEPT